MEVWASLIGSILTSIFALIGVVVTSRKQHDVTITEVKAEIALIKKDINNLEKKQDKHNSVIERMYAAEKAIEVMEEKQKVANHRIDDIEAQI